jgi:predicted dehydrogenase
MHQQAGKEAYGADVPTTRDYRSLLDRKDVDAVIVAVPDHPASPRGAGLLAAGKDVYCEKPMSHNVADGLAMVKAVVASASSRRQPTRQQHRLQEGGGDLCVGPAWAKCI